MRKGDENKLRMFLTGVAARLEKNREYFVEIRLVFQAGNRDVQGRIAIEQNGTLCLQYQGICKPLESGEIPTFFLQEAALYEASRLRYAERGSCIEIVCSSRGVSMKQRETQAEPVDPGNAGARNYIIRPDKAGVLLREIGIMAQNGKIKNDKIRKYSQIDHFVELVGPMFQKEQEEIVLLDCACGKSYLSFVLNFYLREVLKKRCHVIGIDNNPQVIAQSRAIARRLQYRNMEFVQADLNDYVPPKAVTGVISLHACDTATDLALAVAVRARAKYIACVPCCHKELLSQMQFPGLEAAARYGIFKARLNDTLTDAMRTLKLAAEGYETQVLEYISPLDTPKNLLILAKRLEKAEESAKREYEALRTYLGTYSTLDRCLDGAVYSMREE